MAEITVQRLTGFTTMSNYHLRDKDLSYKAKGLLSFMYSLPEDWDYSLKGLASISKEGIKAIRNIMAELIERGYVVRTRQRESNGLFSYSYLVRMYPFDTDDRPEIQPHSPLRHTVERHADKGTQINTNKQYIKKESKKLFIYSENEKNNYENFQIEKPKRKSWDELIDERDLSDEVKILLKTKWIPYKVSALKSVNSFLSNDAVEYCLDDLLDLSSDKDEQIKIIKQAIKAGDFTFSPLNVKKSSPKKEKKLVNETNNQKQEVKDEIVETNADIKETEIISDDNYHCDNDKEAFLQFAYEGKSSEEQWQEYYDKDPVVFLQSKQKIEVSKSNKKLLKDLKTKFNMEDAVINVLVEYILAYKDQRLDRPYVETIASQWVRMGVNDVKAARKAARPILKAIREELLDSYFKNNSSDSEVNPVNCVSYGDKERSSATEERI